MDLQHFSSFMKSMSNEHFETCNDMLRENCNLYFTFSKEDLNNVKKDVKSNFRLWAKRLSRNRNGHSVTYSAEYPSLTNLHQMDKEKRFSALTSICMVSDALDDQILTTPAGEELSLLRQFTIEDKNIPTKKFLTRKMKDWEVIRNNSLSCSDIIIVDLYLFAQSDLLYERNSYQLVLDLCSKVKSNVVNIVFFTMGKMKIEQQIKKGNKIETVKKYIDIPIRTIYRNIKNKLKNELDIESNVTFVLLNKEEHDRTIFTNYKLFDSGDSFKYFNDDKQDSSSSKGRWVHVNTMIEDGIYLLSKEFIDDLQVIVNNMKSSASGIQGDTKCNFLDFSLINAIRLH